MKKPELLVPVGNNETFYAALEGGADAIYLGLKRFNARERAKNFSFAQIPVIIDEAHKKNCKVFITLNTVIKNNELDELVDTLHFLEQIKPDAVIIQDWGVYYLIKKFFPEINIHASTQMANHNSLGTKFSLQKEFDRVILARELTLQELEIIQKKSISDLDADKTTYKSKRTRLLESKIKKNIDLEIFIHGALCYSFSGMCYFSSFLGGHSANRGHCTQPCRRLFSVDDETKYFFSLKDNEQIELIPKFEKIGIRSLKIEGRLKSDDYVYRVASAYRMAIDDHEKISEAKKLLALDMGREKTSYFLGGSIKDAITQNPNTGLFAGKITKIIKDGFSFESKYEFTGGERIRVKSNETDTQINIKVKEYTQNANIVDVKAEGEFAEGNTVYISGKTEKKFPNKLPDISEESFPKIEKKRKRQILNRAAPIIEREFFSLFVRIDSNDWIRKVDFKRIDKLIINLTHTEWEDFRVNSKIIQENKKKIWFELPHFIPESKIDFYKEMIGFMSEKGLTRYFLSHISQKLLLPPESTFAVNENVYTFNDIAIRFLKNEGAKYVTYPSETTKDNLYSYEFKTGILPLYFYPKLYVSRMPVKIPSKVTFTDDTNNDCKKIVRNGITYVVSDIPVSFLQYSKQFKDDDFKNFLIDFSFEKPSSNRFNTIIGRYFRSEQLQPSHNYNYKRELK